MLRLPAVSGLTGGEVMSWQEQLRGDPLPWLLEKDVPGVRYLALRDMLDRKVVGKIVIEP